MRILQSSFIFLLFTLLFQSVFATELFKFDRNVAGFVNYSSPQSLMFSSQDGKTNWMTDTTVIKTTNYQIINSICTPRSQNTMDMDGSQAGMTLAYPFLVGIGFVCKIDEQRNSIYLVSNFTVPENAYSVVYAGQDTNSAYFLINSKPTQGDGYLHLVSISKLTDQVTTRVFATNVPGYSGAMLFDNGDVFVTSWPKKIFKISNSNLLRLAQGSTQANFLQIAQLVFSGIDGMSFFMLKNDKSLLYYNVYDGEDYDSYTVNVSNKIRSNVSIPCPPVAGYKQEWLLLCGGTSLQTWYE